MRGGADEPRPTMAWSDRASNAPWIPSEGSGDCTVSVCRQPPLALYTTVSPSKIAQSSLRDRKSTRLNSSHGYISYAVFCLKKKKNNGDRSITFNNDYRYVVDTTG